MKANFSNFFKFMFFNNKSNAISNIYFEFYSGTIPENCGALNPDNFLLAKDDINKYDLVVDSSYSCLYITIPYRSSYQKIQAINSGILSFIRFYYITYYNQINGILFDVDVSPLNKQIVKNDFISLNFIRINV